MDLSAEERVILAGERGEAARRALHYQIEVGGFWGARRFVPVTNVHMMGDIEVMGGGGLAWLREEAGLGARCAVPTTTNARCFDFAYCERLGQDLGEAAKERELIQCLRRVVRLRCSGARVMKRSSFSTISWSTRIGAEKSSPPWTTRWPTAARSQPCCVSRSHFSRKFRLA